MFKIKNITLAAILIANSAALVQAQSQQSQRLIYKVPTVVFEDAFNHASLDTSKWDINLGHEAPNGGAPQWGTWEVQKYINRPENLSVSNGLLKITPTRSLDPFIRDSNGNPTGRTRTNGAVDSNGRPVQHIHWVFSSTNDDGTYTCIDQATADRILPAPSWGGPVLRCEKNLLPAEKGAWNSARIATKKDFKPLDNQIMVIEARIQLPDVTGNQAIGYWPAFWMLGSHFKSNAKTWPAIGEIDIMENVNGLNELFGTLHCGEWNSPHCNSPSGRSSTKVPSVGTLQNSFHTYRMEWDKSVTPHELRWYLDGVKYHTVKATDFPPQLKVKKSQNTNGKYEISWFNSDGSTYPSGGSQLKVEMSELPPTLAGLELDKIVPAIDYWNEAFNKHGHNIILNVAMGGAWATPDANGRFSRAAIDEINKVGHTNQLPSEFGGGYWTSYEPAAIGKNPDGSLRPVPTPWNSTLSGKSMVVDYVKVTTQEGGKTVQRDNHFQHTIPMHGILPVIYVQPTINGTLDRNNKRYVTFKYSVNDGKSWKSINWMAQWNKPGHYRSYTTIFNSVKQGQTLTYYFQQGSKVSPKYRVTK